MSWFLHVFSMCPHVLLELLLMLRTGCCSRARTARLPCNASSPDSHSSNNARARNASLQQSVHEKKKSHLPFNIYICFNCALLEIHIVVRQSANDSCCLTLMHKLIKSYVGISVKTSSSCSATLEINVSETSQKGQLLQCNLFRLSSTMQFYSNLIFVLVITYIFNMYRYRHTKALEHCLDDTCMCTVMRLYVRS